MPEYYNAPEHGQLMNKYIDSGRTVLFTDEEKAKAFAEKNHSYAFQVWEKLKNNKRLPYGWAVSK